MEALEESRRNFINTYGKRNYWTYDAIRSRVRDVVSGTATIKSVGDKKFTKAYQYLIPTERQKNNTDEYVRYLEMAVFYEYTAASAMVGLGMIATGKPSIAGLPDDLAGLEWRATPYGDGLQALQLRMNTAQFVDGGCVTVLEINPDEKIRQGYPPCYINRYSMDKLIDNRFEFRDGQSFTRFVLMDESDYVYDYKTKHESIVNKYRIFGLDAQNRYYQAALTEDQWGGEKSFDIFNPPVAKNPLNPQFGEAVYPQLYNRYLDVVPVVWCNVTNLSGAHYEKPFLSDIADLDIAIYNADAAYRQTLWLTSQPVFTIIGGKGEEIKIPMGAGVVHFLPEGYKEQFTEFSGAGANAQKEALDKLHEIVNRKAMSLFPVNDNQSGEALKIIQGSQVAPLVTMVNTSGNAITQLLRYAGRWKQMKEEQIQDIIYTPSEAYARRNLDFSEILQFINMKERNPNIPVLRSEIRQKMIENGWGNESVSDFDQFMELVDEENAKYGNMLNADAELG